MYDVEGKSFRKQQSKLYVYEQRSQIPTTIIKCVQYMWRASDLNLVLSPAPISRHFSRGTHVDG